MLCTEYGIPACSRRAFCAGALAGAMACAAGLVGCGRHGGTFARVAGSSVGKKRARSKKGKGEVDARAAGTSSAAKWLDGARDAVRSAVDACGGSVSVCCTALDPATFAVLDGEIAIAADERHVAASVIKLAVLARALDAAAAGTLSLDERICVREQDIVGGSGDIQAKGAGVTYSVDELLHAMVAQSDNVAANLMIERLGMDSVNAECERLGLSDTQLERFMMDTAAQAAGRENHTSAADASKILELIAAGGIGTAELCERARGYLLDQRDNRGIAEGVAAGIPVAHKTGSLANAQHDAAIVYASRPYVLTVLTQDMEREQALELERTISAAVYQASIS